MPYHKRPDRIRNAAAVLEAMRPCREAMIRGIAEREQAADNSVFTNTSASVVMHDAAWAGRLGRVAPPS